MKYLQRLLCVFSVVALLFVTFSTSVSAETINNYEVSSYTLLSTNRATVNTAFTQNYPLNNTNYKRLEQVPFDEDGYKDYLQHTLSVNLPNNQILVKKGKKVSLAITNLTFGYTVDGGAFKPITEYDGLFFKLTYMDGTTKIVSENVTFATTKNKHAFECEFTAEQNVAKVSISLTYNLAKRDGLRGDHTFVFYFSNNLTDNPQPQVDIQSEESGLLSGLLQWVKDIWNSIKEIPSKVFDAFKSALENISNWLSSVYDSIVALPQKLWNLIKEGLQALFVPNEEFMANYSQTWDDLFASRFGAIYQVGSIITDFASDIVVMDETNTINFPKVSLKNVGIPFEFGGYDVKIVPNNFGTLAEICKKIISITCTFLFINGLRKRYDEVMGVEQ